MNGNVLPVLAADAVLAIPCSKDEGSSQGFNDVLDMKAVTSINMTACDELHYHLSSKICRQQQACMH